MYRRSACNTEGGGKRAVTPVVALVLMITVTIVLAGTAAAFLLTIGDGEMAGTPPTFAADFSHDTDPGGHDAFRITHDNGEAVDPDTLYVQLDDVDCDGGSVAVDRPNVKSDLGFGGDFTAGKSVEVDPTVVCTGGGALDLTSATVHLVWQDVDGSTHVLDTWYAN